MLNAYRNQFIIDLKHAHTNTKEEYIERERKKNNDDNDYNAIHYNYICV